MDDNIDALREQAEGIELTEEEQARIEDRGDALVVTLLEPLTFKPSKLDDERTVEALTLPKRIKGKHLKKMDQVTGQVSQGLALIAALAGVPAFAMDELDARDLDLCQVAIEPFLPKRRKTGRR